MARPTIAAVVLTLNEEANLSFCLPSIQWVDELVVLDSGSTDRTREVAEEHGARVEVHRPSKFLISEQRNHALDHCGIRSDWVLFVDADEQITDELREEIRAELAGCPADVVGYRLCFKFMFLGRWLKRTSQFPSWHDRLVKRSHLRFTGGVWETFEETEGTIRTLREPYLHYGFRNGFAAWLARHMRYADDNAARALAARKTRVRILRLLRPDHPRARREVLGALGARVLWLSPVLRFGYHYVLRGGFLDGFPGFVYSGLMGLFQMLVFVRALELGREREGSTL